MNKSYRFPPEKLLKIRLFFCYQLWQYLLVISSICLCSYLFNKWIEGIAFCVAHCIIRYKMNYVYHSKNYCLQLTLFIIWCCIPTIAKTNISLLSAIPVAFLICWIGCVVQEKNILFKRNSKLSKENAEFIEKLKPKPFNVDNCSRDELLARCAEVRLSEFNTELAIEFFINKTKQSIIADRLCIDEKSITQKKQRLKKKLNIPQ